MAEKNQAAAPPPSNLEEGWKWYGSSDEPDNPLFRYWNGSEWQGEPVPEDLLGLHREGRGRDRFRGHGIFVVIGVLLGFVAFVVVLWLLLRGDGDTSDSDGERDPGAEPSGEETPTPTQSPTEETADDGDTADACAPGRTYTGDGDDFLVEVEGLPGSGEGVGSVEFTVGQDCVVEAHIAFAEQSQNDEWITPTNTLGHHCTVAEFDGGRQFYSTESGPAGEVAALTLVPDAEGAGIVSGWMVASHGGLDEACPRSDDLSDAIGQYLGNPTGGLFRGSVADGVLSGDAEFSGTESFPALRTVTLNLRAFCTEKCG